MKHIVYITVNTVNRKIYIGVHSTEDPYKFDGYIGCGINQYTKTFKAYPLHFAVKKYGYDKFERLTLGIFDTIEEAYIQEAKIVDRNFLKRKDTYNAKIGGLGGNGNYKKVIQYTMDGKFLKVWDSLQEICLAFNKKSHNRISKCINGESDHWIGYQWKPHTEEFPKVIPPAQRLEIPIHQYGEDGMFIKTWKNKLVASKGLKCSSSGLRHATQSLNIYYGYQWRYFKEVDPPITIPRYINSKIVIQIDRVTKEVLNEWEKLSDIYKDGYKVNRLMQPKNNISKKFIWKYKKDYMLEQDYDIVHNS